MMKNILTAIALVGATVVQGQIGPGIQWQRCIGGTYLDFGYYVQETTGGDYLVAGYSASIDGDITCSNGGTNGVGNGDGVAARLDSTGSIVWVNCLGNNAGFPQSESALSALEFANGESFFFGQFDGPGRFNLDGSPSALPSPTGGRQGIVAADSNIVIVDLDGDLRKYTPTGTPIWTRDNTGVYNIRNTPDGGFVTVTQGGRISKRNSLGNTEWSQTLLPTGQTVPDNFKSVTLAADGGYVVCGATLNPDVPGFHDAPGFPENPDVWVVKFDSAGNILWQRAYGGNSGEAGFSITSAQDGGVVILCGIGAAFGGVPPGGDILEFKGGTDYWVIKLDADGELEWQRTLGSSNSDDPYWIEATADGGYVITGYTNGADGDVQGAYHVAGTGFDIWTVRLESEFKDTDGDGTPDFEDVCVDGPEPGTTCDDGNALTALDVITGDCQCVGQPDGDGDGVPDVSDVCPGGPDPGAACNDGDPFTALDTVDGNCQCVGQPDADGDGVPDANDQCPGGPDPGQPCNDGNPFTTLDSVTAACQCVGQPDADQDGDPDVGDPCPLQAGLIPGEPCDDGNPLTTNDLVAAFGINCACNGEPDDDADGVPNDEDVCPGGPDPGTFCDDGNSLTTLDIITAGCQCIGQSDSDGDGVPNEQDVCPAGPDPGQPCNDGNPLTALDAITASCQCIGQSDSDGDGVPDTGDVCPAGPEPGQSCSDGNPFTALDTVTASCQCIGQPDSDQDGNPDADDPCPLQAGFVPGGPCDDGNPFTANDVVSAFGVSCLCQGVPDDDGDGVPNEQDVCPGGPDPGQACDDGNPLTAEDTVTANCGCVGLPDNDQDGQPDAEDPCPVQAGLIPGEPCDDGNPNTENDVVVSFGLNCLCQGEFSTGLQEASAGSLRIVPNPSSGVVTITAQIGGAGATVSLFDAYGRVVLRERLTSERQAFDLAELAKGLYTVTVQTDGGMASQRLVLE
jgi:hypothetical protein